MKYRKYERERAEMLKIDEKTALLDDNKNLTKVYEGPDVEVTIKGKCFGMQDFRLFYGTERF